MKLRSLVLGVVVVLPAVGWSAEKMVAAESSGTCLSATVQYKCPSQAFPVCRYAASADPTKSCDCACNTVTLEEVMRTWPPVRSQVAQRN